MTEFRAYVLREAEDKAAQGGFETLTTDDLPDGDVLVRVQYSSLNYKDGLAVTGAGKIARSFPMVAGIDFAGEVVESSSDEYAPGDAVVLTGWGAGEKHWGGYAEYARVPAGWLVPLPDGLSTKTAMALGTAGFTAALAVMGLEEHGLEPGDGEVIVTGASGGVGSVAVALLAALGHTVIASTGRDQLTDYLKGLGASDVIGRFEAPARPMASARWAGAVDGVGGETLAALLAEMQDEASIAAYGLAGGHKLETTVFPFILRGVKLLGINSVTCPLPRRRTAWLRLAADLPASALETITSVKPFSEIETLAERIVAGDIRGRVVIDINEGNPS